MERYRETTIRDKKEMLWLWLAVAALLAWLGIEAKSYLAGRPSMLGISYVLFFFGLLIWRFAFRYTYILTDTEFIVTSEGLGLTRTFTVPLEKVESFSNRYQKKFFKRTGIRRYLYRYSSGDPRPTRILVFSEAGKMSAILFKVGDRFIDELRQAMPEKFLNFSDDKK